MSENTGPASTAGSVVHCPECGGRFSADPTVLSTFDATSQVLCLCGACSAAFPLPSAASSVTSTPLTTTGESLAPAATEAIDSGFAAGRVVVGLEIPSAQRTVAEVLRNKGFSPVCVTTGEMVVAACDPVMPERPVAVVLDVAIPGVLAFEAISAIRAFAGGDAISIILLASVYERTRYKRRPNRLYGADAYLELHHVPDQLVSMIDALAHDRVPSATRHQSPRDRAKTAPLRDPGHDGGPLSIEQARVLARRLLSDVALYHGDEIAAGVAADEPLRDVQEALEAACELFMTRTSGDRRVFDEMVAAFVEQLLNRNVAHEEASPSL